MDRAFEEDSTSMQTEEESRLFIAVKECDLDQANRLITKGVKVNSLDDLGSLAVDYAWTNKFYDAVLLLLKSDSKFPKQFDFYQLNENDGSAQDLLNFVEERICLHRSIEEDNLEQVQELISKTKYKSHFFFNKQNESALYAAIKRRKIKIYAYLRSIGAEFSSEDEKKELDQLDFKDRVALKDSMVYHFPGVSGGPIHYLISKSRSQKPVEGFEHKLKDFYSKLYQIPEISDIFRVIQHADSLDIVFDFDEENVTKVNPTVSKSTKGETNWKEGRLYIAAGLTRGERKILGTIAHELTHMAMQILFGNDCKPYLSSVEENEKEFERITRKMLNIEDHEGDPSQIVLNVQKGYREEDHHCELIVTVPQILAEHEDGRKWLEENALELLEFYNKKIVAKCHEFDKKSVTRKIQKEVRSLNETLGEINKLKKFNATFRNLSDIINFLNDQNMKIFILRTKYTFLGMMKILQSIYGESYIDSYDKYLLAELSSTSPIKEMVLTFYLNTCDTLILKCVDDSFKKVLIDEFWDTARDILESNPDKRLIFLVHPNVEESFFRTLKTQRMEDICADKKDENNSLNELSEKSRREILSKKVIFQGGEIVLSKLTSADENIFKLVTGDVLESLIQGNQVHIGEKTFDHYNLNSFSYVGEEVKLKTFIREFKNSKDVFVIQGVHEKDKLMEYFKDLIQSKLITKQKLADQIYILDTKCFEIGSRRLILTDENFSEENFQSFCRHNWDKKIYLIEVEDLKFVLKQLYNPNFYLERKFKIIISQDKLRDLIKKLPNEMFVVGMTLRHHGVELDYDENVEFVKAEVSETIFNKHVKNKITVHWFLVPDWKMIYWKNSYGSSSSLWLDFNNLETNDNCLLEETNLVTHLDKKKVMILSDNPGMGKSTTLTKLYESPTIAQTHWVIRIDLKTHLESIKKVEANNMSVKTIIDFLKGPNSNFDNKLTQDLLESALRPEGTFMTKVLFAFDGFDELLDDKARNTVIAMLKYMRDNTRCKIWITTRLHYKKTLEDVLGTFAFQFEPIDDENKGIYVTRYLQERLKITFEPELAEDVFDPNSKFQFYVEGFLKIINHVFTKNVATFIGTPLQLYLMTENSLKHFKNWIDGNDNMVYFSQFGNNILSVFENFIHGKYEIYFKKQKIFEEYMKEDAKEKADEYHKALAESLTRNKSLSKKHEKKNSMMLLIGLIQSVDQKNLEFIHFTFREYFAALIFQDCISEEPPDFKYLVFLLENKEFRVVRNFINLLLENFSVEGLPDENLETFKEILDVSGSELSATMKNIFWNIVKENNGNILDFVFLICGEDFSLISDLLTLDSEDLMLLHVAISNGNKQITEALFKAMEKLSTENQKEILKASSNYGTIFELAVFGHCLPVVKIVFEKLELVLEPNELKSFLQEVFVDDRGIYPQIELRYKQSLFHYLAETGNIEMTLFLLEKVQELLPEQQKEILTMSNTGGQDILYVALRNGHVELAKIILAKLDGVLSPVEQINLFSWPCTQYPIVSDKMECTVHVSATLGNLEVMEIFYEKYKAANWLKEFVTMTNSSLKTISHIATQKGHTKLVKMLVEKMDEILFSTEEQVEAEGSDQEVVRKEEDERGEKEEEEPERNDQETEEKNEEAEVKVEDAEGKEKKLIEFIAMEVKYGNTVLHLAARNGNIEVMNIWLEKWDLLPPEKRKEIITLQNGYGQSILHVIIQKGHTELMEMILPRLNASLLLETEKVIMMTDNNEQTILHLAVAHGNTEMVKILLDKGLNNLSPKGRLEFVLMTDNNSQTILHLAAAHGNTEMVKILLDIGLNNLSPKKRLEFVLMTDNEKDTALHLAAGNGNFEVALMLLGISEQLSVEKEFLLMENSFSETVFHVASQSGHAQLLRMLLKKAEQLLSPEVQEILTEKLKGLNAHHETVLHLAAKSGNFEVLTIWLERLSREEQKEMILMKNNRCHNILYTAAEKDHNEFIKALLEKINGILSAEEQKQFILAMSNKSVYSKEKKETVLHLAARLNKIELMKTLLEKSEKLSILKELIERRNSSSKTAFDIVSGRYFKEMERMLQEKMDEVQSTEARD